MRLGIAMASAAPVNRLGGAQQFGNGAAAAPPPPLLPPTPERKKLKKETGGAQQRMSRRGGWRKPLCPRRGATASSPAVAEARPRSDTEGLPQGSFPPPPSSPFSTAVQLPPITEEDRWQSSGDRRGPSQCLWRVRTQQPQILPPSFSLWEELDSREPHPTLSLLSRAR